MENKTVMHNRLSWFSKDIDEGSTYLRELFNDEKVLIQDVISSINDKSILYQKEYSLEPLLRGLTPLFDEINHHLINERGFIIVKNFPTVDKKHSIEKIKRFFLDFCLFLGEPLRQNRNEDIIFDVKSIKGENIHTKNFRGPYIKDALPMHTDAGAILGMYCLSASELGGQTLLSSARVIHDEIKRLQPDLLSILYEPFYVDRRGQEPVGALPYDISPIFAMIDNELICQYHSPFYQDVHKKNAMIAPLSLKQLEALAFFDETALREDIVLQTKLEAGDIIFINNEKILHGRTSFDFTDNDEERHLLRIWLSTEKIKNTFPNFMGYL